VRIFADTNVLASAFGTRGLCAELLEIVIEQHELVVGELVLGDCSVSCAASFIFRPTNVERSIPFSGNSRLLPRRTISPPCQLLIRQMPRFSHQPSKEGATFLSQAIANC